MKVQKCVLVGLPVRFDQLPNGVDSLRSKEGCGILANPRESGDVIVNSQACHILVIILVALALDPCLEPMRCHRNRRAGNFNLEMNDTILKELLAVLKDSEVRDFQKSVGRNDGEDNRLGLFDLGVVGVREEFKGKLVTLVIVNRHDTLKHAKTSRVVVDYEEIPANIRVVKNNVGESDK